MEFIAYLAGPISGLSYDASVDWREEAVQQLKKYNILGMSPMRGKGYLKGLQKIADSYEGISMSSTRGIMTRDYFDCTRADILIVNFLGAQKVSIGTVMEVAWAYQNHTPVIVIIEPEGNVHDHGMMNEVFGFRVGSLEEAVTVAAAVLLPVPHSDTIG